MWESAGAGRLGRQGGAPVSAVGGDGMSQSRGAWEAPPGREREAGVWAAGVEAT